MAKLELEVGIDVLLLETGDALLLEGAVTYNTPMGTKNSWAWSTIIFDSAETCPVGSKNAWDWLVPTSGGGSQTMHGTKDSWSWGNE